MWMQLVILSLFRRPRDCSPVSPPPAAISYHSLSVGDTVDLALFEDRGAFERLSEFLCRFLRVSFLVDFLLIRRSPADTKERSQEPKCRDERRRSTNEDFSRSDM